MIELKNIDADEVNEIHKKIEDSFSFKFGKNELKRVTTFGELWDIIISKVHGDNINECTIQQAFYKL